MKFKETVRFGNGQVAIMAAMIIANDVYRELGYNMVVTSANDSNHKNGSKHYSDEAFDCRIKDLKPGHAVQITELLKMRLTKDFDVILETNHIHIEYDPK